MSNISKQENEKAEFIISRVEEIRKIGKQFQTIFLENLNESESFGKKLQQATNNFSSNICWSKGENMPILFNDFGKLFNQMSQHLLQEFPLFQKQFQQKFQALLEEVKQKNKQITESTDKSLKIFSQSQGNYLKKREKYDKLCKETDSAIQDLEKLQIDAATFYNPVVNQKQRIKIKDNIKDIGEKELQVQQLIDETNNSQKTCQTTINDCFGQIKQLFKAVLVSIMDNALENEIKYEQIFRVMKQYIEENNQNFQNVDIKNDTQVEDQTIQEKQQVISSSTSSNNLDSVQNQSINYLSIQEKCNQKQELSDKDCQMFLDCATKYMDNIQEYIDNRKKNFNNLKQFFVEINEIFDNYSKYLMKISGKISLSPTILAKKAYTFFEVYLTGTENIGKKFNSFLQIFVVKIQQIQSMIQDQNLQEKGLNNLKSKIFQEIKQINKTDILKKKIQDTVNIIYISLSSYRNNEQGRLQSMKSTIFDFITQLQQTFEDLLKLLIQIQQNTQLKKEEIDDEIVAAFSHDEKMFQLEYENKNQDFLQFQTQFQKPSNLNLEVNEEIINMSNQNSSESANSQDQQQQQQQSNQQQNLLDPNNAGKISKNLQIKFNINENDNLIETCACALSHKILLQGRLYIYQTKLCFHSYFNNVNLVGETILVIPIEDVIRIEKRVNALIFHNAIAIITQRGEIVLASFMARDETYDLIKKVINKEPIQKKTSQKNSNDSNQQDQLNLSNDEQQSNNINQSEEKKKNLSISQNNSPIGKPKITFQLSPDANGNLEDKQQQQQQQQLDDSSQKGAEESKIQNEVQTNNNNNNNNQINKKLESQLQVEANQNQVNASPNKKEVITEKNNNQKQQQSQQQQLIQQQSSDQKKENQQQKQQQPQQQQQQQIQQQQQQSQEIKKESNQNQQQQQQKPNVIEANNQQNNNQQQIQQQMLAKLQGVFQNRYNKYKQQLQLMLNKTADLTLKFQLQNTTLREFFYHFLYVPYTYNNKKYLNVNEYLMQSQGEFEMVQSNYSPLPPKIFCDLESDQFQQLESFEDYSFKELKFQHPIKQNMPFLPKNCTVTIKEKYYWISDKEIFIDKEIVVTKAPMSDNFTQYNTIHLLENNNQVLYENIVYINFVKSTMFKSKIKSASIEESTEYFQSTQKYIQNFFKTIEQNKIIQQNKKAKEQQAQLQAQIEQQNNNIKNIPVVQQEQVPLINANNQNVIKQEEEIKQQNNQQQSEQKEPQKIENQENNQLLQENDDKNNKKIDQQILNKEGGQDIISQLKDMRELQTSMNKQLQNIIYLLAALVMINLLNLIFK